jgi:membrane protein
VGTLFAPDIRGMRKKLTAWRNVAVATFKNWFAHDSMAESAALAYYTVFSLAPVLLVVVAIAGAVFGQDAVRGRLVDQFGGMMGKEQAALVQTILQKAERENTNGLAAVVGFVTLIVGATAVFSQLQASLNRVWEVHPKQGHFLRDFIRKRLLSFAIVVAIGFLLLVSLVVSTGIEALRNYVSQRFSTEPVWLEWANALLSFALFALLFAMIYRILPDARIPWRDVWLGAIVTSLLFVFGKWAIGFYLGRTAATSAFGAAASVIVLLLWVYYASLIVLFGAEFTHAYAKLLEEHVTPPEAGARRQPRKKSA